MAKISISVSLNPEDAEEQKDPNVYQSIAYTLNGMKAKTKIEELNDLIYEWLKKQKK